MKPIFDFLFRELTGTIVLVGKVLNVVH